MKKILAIVLVTLLLALNVTASLAEKVEGEEDEVKVFSLETATEYALEHSNGIKLLNMEIENIELGGRQAERIARRTRDNRSSLDSITVEGAELQAKQKKMELEEALIQLKNAKKSIKMGVARAYYGTIAAEENLRIEKVNYENVRNQHDITKLKHELGNASKSDLIFAENSLKTAEIAVKNAKSSVEKGKLGLKQAIGMDLWEKIEIEGNFEKAIIDEIDLMEVIEASYETRLDVISAKNMLILAEEDFRINSIKYPSNTYIYREKEKVADMVALRHEDTIRTVQQDILNKHMNLEDAARNIEEFKTIVENAEEGLRLNELSYEAGLATIYEVDQSRKQLLEVQLGLATAIHNFNIAAMDFEKTITIGD